MELETIRIPLDLERVIDLVALVRGRGRDLLQPAAQQVDIWFSPKEGAALIAVLWASEEDHERTAGRPEVQEFFGQVAELATGAPRLESYLDPDV